MKQTLVCMYVHYVHLITYHIQIVFVSGGLTSALHLGLGKIDSLKILLNKYAKYYTNIWCYKYYYYFETIRSLNLS